MSIDLWYTSTGGADGPDPEQNEGNHPEDNLIGRSHHPDLTERLIEAHRTLHMSRDYLYGLYPHGHRAADEITNAMAALGAAIEAL